MAMVSDERSFAWQRTTLHTVEQTEICASASLAALCKAHCPLSRMLPM